MAPDSLNIPVEDRPADFEAGQLARLLAHVEFEDPSAALHCLTRIPRDESETQALLPLLPGLVQLLSDAAHPNQVLLNLEKLIHSTDEPLRLLQILSYEPRVLEALVILFAGSQFLSDVFIRNPAYFQQLREPQALSQLKLRPKTYAETGDQVVPANSLAQNLDNLRRYQRREMLRIGAGDLLGAMNFEGVVDQLSNLARSLIRVCCRLVADELGMPEDDFAVIALGKLGGRELNYSSDVDLIFVVRNPGARHTKLGQELIRALSQATDEGFFYRVDMRLRPWGKVGNLVPGFEENLAYLRKNAQLWEKQAMMKGRRIAGDQVMGIEFLEQVKAVVADLPATPLRQEALKMKSKIESALKKRKQSWGQVKGGAGSIRDVEFVTQYLQLTHAQQTPEIKSRNTLDGLARLTACGIVPQSDYRVLAEGYVFLRTIEHHLQIMHYRQTHQLPSAARELTFLAKRLGFQGERVGEQMAERYEQHSQAIRSIFQRCFSGEPLFQPVAGKTKPQPATKQESSKHLARMDEAYACAFDDATIHQHTELADSLTGGRPARVHASQLSESDWRVTIVAFDALGELSLICGLLFDYGIYIVEGSIFTYEAGGRQATSGAVARRGPRRRRRGNRTRHDDPRRKIVDVFTVRSLTSELNADVWQRYERELSENVTLLRDMQQNEVQGELAKRVALALSKFSKQSDPLLPVEIAIDNTASREYTVLRIDAPDTIGFLYEFTNALSLNGVYIARVQIQTLGNRVHDTLFVTDVQGRKITDPEKQYQLRVATALVKHFTHLLPDSPNPQSAMMNFRSFVSNLFSREQWSKELASLERPEVLETLSRLLGVSEFLWNDFLRMQHANLFPLVTDLSQLAQPKPKSILIDELNRALEDAAEWPEKVKILNEFKDREMFRIDMRYIMGVNPDLHRFARELSNLADAVIEVASKLCFDRLCKAHGRPCLEFGDDCSFSVCSLGKLGGREIGFASDIELIFLYAGKGRTTGPDSITNNEFFVKLVHDFRKTIQSRHEGTFEIDLRMRPYGKGGSVAVPLALMKSYYSENGAAWDYERQALVKLRPVAGDASFAGEITVARDGILYTDKPFAVSNLRAMRERQVRQLVAGGTINAKFSPGGLVDLEYLVQALQLTNGKQRPELRLTNTTEAMAALCDHGVLSASDHASLKDAHLFLRRLVEGLRMVRGNARDLAVPERGSDAFMFLARRLDYGDDSERLYDDLEKFTSEVQRISEKMLK